ncbi:MAPEG family protein [Novosphingobium sp. YJ-S2-02]|uniref:MAPEG family protein n=1 Tax=Novosphingobium aureum TaxID=2792964 RepID=A0A931HCI9_9SPHN|nr:MAPEG family protein [Novosphingobium aureum]MBH0113525.1 MAPEG family protein [Novosphingobium aureum]
MILQTTLSLAAAAAIINFWLAFRAGRLRAMHKIWHGDGENPLLMRRMRAQANFVEHTPFLLILVAVIEMTGKGGTWLALAGALYMTARILHAFGMDKGEPNLLRAIGFGFTMLVILGLCIVAVMISLGRF